ncbi:Microtubules assembly and stabilization protein [Collariella sp. IMI 366227]|nr:Microtubules assembly and stabilization protein [Collariella sp. IMI 366227]
MSTSGHDANTPTASPISPLTPANGTHSEPPKQTTLARSNSARTSSDEKKPPPTTPSPHRRNSWFSNISSKFTSSGASAGQSPPQANTAPPKPAEFSIPKVIPAKNAVLQHASKPEGEGPYTPAPPRSSQTGLLQVFRRLSSSNGTLSPNPKSHNHGLVERRILNVDRHRERCGINGLNQAKLRRVAFCVDVEIAPEANGTIPMELHLDDDTTDSSSIATTPRPGTPNNRTPPRLRQPHHQPLTEQLLDPANCSTEPGMVEKLDLSGYWMQLTDLITLGDYLAVVPVREVILEGCGLTDEGLRVILAGLLAARKPKAKKRRHHGPDDSWTEQGGVVERLVLKNNKVGPEGWKHGLGTLADALVVENCPLWALSLADCNLTPSSLCKLLPTLAKLTQFRFIDLSHNQELFSSNPSAVCVLRRYLPKMPCLKRIHLADCALSPEQAIALAEILPEVSGLAHVSFLENPQLVELATNAKTEEAQEEACALYASLLAATRVSTSLVAMDIEVPSEQSCDLVKALAKQVVAYCLRNMELLAATAAEAQAELLAKPEPEYPDVLQRLVGHDILLSQGMDEDVDAAPDDDYVIGGTGVVRALACCLKNRGDESRRQSGEFIRDVENGVSQPPRAVPSGGKAKETSKHLLMSARKIRLRLQPAIDKARATEQDTHTYYRLMFLDNTLHGIIKRFEDEFPDTRISNSNDPNFHTNPDDTTFTISPPTAEAEVDHDSILTAGAPGSISDSDDDDLHPDPTTHHLLEPDTVIKSPALSRSNSLISLSSKALAHEEGRILRAGHKFRAGVLTGPAASRRSEEHYALLASGVEMVGADPNHARLLHELMEELRDEEVMREVGERGAVEVFKERREEVLGRLREADPVYWERFVESQEMARKNVGGGESAVEED